MKKILVLILILFITGCSAEYDLTITNKEVIKERFNVYISNQEISKTYDGTVDEYLDYYSHLYTSNQGYSEFNIETKKGKDQSRFIVTREYKSLDEYIKSVSFRTMFSNATIERIGNYISFQTPSNIYIQTLKENMDPEITKFDSFKIKIKFYNEIVHSNADEVDLKNNIYTWIVNENDEDSSINFKIGPKVKYNVIIKDFIMTNIIPISVASTAIVALGIFVLIICIKSKKNNEV